LLIIDQVRNNDQSGGNGRNGGEGSERQFLRSMKRHWSVQLQREQLHRAAEHGNLAKVKDLLRQKYPVNRFDDLGRTPLHYAAVGEHLAIVELLLRAGAHVNAHDERVIGDTPLAACARSCSLEMAERLIQAGAAPRLLGFMGLTARHRADENNRAVCPKVVELLQKAAARHGA
jgi:ankyrin repeat protein